MKRTKVIATIGPASQDVETLKQMIAAGMNAARLNFSHGTYASHAALVKNIRTAASKTGQFVPIIQDLSGPKLRLGEFEEKDLQAGELVVLGHGGIPVQKEIWQWVRPGQMILIDDGLLELVVTRINADHLEAKVLSGGKVVSHKGINLPGVKVNLPVLSQKDLSDLEFGLKMGIDYIALSFVKTGLDVADLRNKIKKIIGKAIPIISKIETPEALKNIDSVIKVSDAVMVARGDLALNIPQELVPVAQKNIIKKCLQAGKPVIVATQMLDSMIRNPRPTRAEILDVANAVIDHADAVMLSGETAFGKNPIKTVETMSKIIDETEESPLDDFYHSERSVKNFKEKNLILAHNLLHVARNADAHAVVLSKFELAQNLARLRSEKELIVYVSKKESDLKTAGLIWGVIPLAWKGSTQTLLRHEGFIHPGQRYVDATGAVVAASIQSMH